MPYPDLMIHLFKQTDEQQMLNKNELPSNSDLAYASAPNTHLQT